MGPVLFLVMINDLLDEWPGRWKYVDDSTATESVMVDCSSNFRIFESGSGYLSDDIERVQRRALRIILPELSYNDARELINIPSLKERREILCEQFFLRDENLQKLDEFLPNKSSSVYDTRGNCKYNNY